MSPDQILLQLGISGAVLFVGYKIALVLLKNWREAESERTTAFSKAESDRTTALAAGFMSLSGKVDQHHSLDIQSHTALATGIAELKGKVDEAIGWQERTPIGGTPIPKSRDTPSRGVRMPRPGSHHDKDG